MPILLITLHLYLFLLFILYSRQILLNFSFILSFYLLILLPQILLLILILLFLLPLNPPHCQIIQRRQIIMPILIQITNEFLSLLNIVHLTNLFYLVLSKLSLFHQLSVLLDMRCNHLVRQDRLNVEPQFGVFS